MDQEEIRLAIVGSVVAHKEDVLPIIEEYVERLNPTAIVSGGADGVDTFAEEYAKENGITPIIFRPEKKGWYWYKKRNDSIAEVCTHLLRIRSKRSRTHGSDYTADRASYLRRIVYREEVP